MPKGKPILAIHLDAGLDLNGHPLRCFVVFNEDGKIIKTIFDENGEIIETKDKGYEGHVTLRRKYPEVPVSERIGVTKEEYCWQMNHGRPEEEGR